jgi:hypothetical protein
VQNTSDAEPEQDIVDDRDHFHCISRAITAARESPEGRAHVRDTGWLDFRRTRPPPPPPLVRNIDRAFCMSLSTELGTCVPSVHFKTTLCFPSHGHN